MSHSHLPLQHLLKQVELYTARRSLKSVRPEWLTTLIDRAAEFFEPLVGEGRVGYDCRLTEQGWEVGLFLGRTEFVGGKVDGASRPTNFEFDLLGLTLLFRQVTSFAWQARPDRDPACHFTDESHLAISGTVGDDEELVRMEIFAVPPGDFKPAFHEFPNGKREPA
ncbi:MAG: hypothetical protein WD065_13145 [Planctomycetaceae bacterium]